METLMIGLTILAGMLAYIIFEMANAPVICESRDEAVYATNAFLTSLTLDEIRELRDPQRREHAITKLGVRGWEYDAYTTCDEYIKMYIQNYPL